MKINSDDLIQKRALTQKTSNPIIEDVRRDWYICDLDGEVLGRVAVKVVNILRGKINKDFTRNFDLGNYVILLNSSKIVLTGDKLSKKKYYNHSGYPGGLRERNAGLMVSKYSNELVYRVIKGMMPHNSLSEKQLTRVFIYSNDSHPHKSQASNFLIINSKKTGK